MSGSRDATLRVWDIVHGRCLHTLVGHLAAVRCVQYDGKLVVSGAYDYMVKVWNPETEECLHTLQGHTNRVYSLQVLDVDFSSFFFFFSFFMTCNDLNSSLPLFSLTVFMWFLVLSIRRFAYGMLQPAHANIH